MWLRIGSVGREFLYHLSDYKLLKEGSVRYSLDSSFADKEIM
jgi:hypothetical protein